MDKPTTKLYLIPAMKILLGLLLSLHSLSTLAADTFDFIISDKPVVIQNTQIWPTIILQKKIADDFDSMITIQPRVSIDEGSLQKDTFNFLGMIGYKLDATNTIWIGYQYMNDDIFDESGKVEHRSIEQYSNEFAFKHFSLSSRLRVEQRFLEGVDEILHRIRLQERINIPLDVDKEWSLKSSAEVFINLNENEEANTQTGFAQTRLFCGVARKINKHLSFELGYLNILKGYGQSKLQMMNIVQFTASYKF